MEAYEDPIACAERGDVDFFKTVAPEILLNARSRDIFGVKTVLIVAALEGHLDCCEVIVKRCPQLLYHQEFIDLSVLHWLVHDYQGVNDDENIMRFLLFTADSRPDFELGGGPKIPNYRLLTMQNVFGNTALHWAVERRNHGATKLLLEADRDFQLLPMVNNRGQTCLHLAVERGYLDMVILICEADLDKQHFLESKDTDIVALFNSQDEEGNTPLHLAVSKGNVEVVRLLLEAPQISAHIANISEQTPYMMAMGKILSDGYGECSDSGMEPFQESTEEYFPSSLPLPQQKSKPKEKKVEGSQTIQQKKNLSWTPSMIQCLVDCMLEIVNNQGKRSDNGVKKNTYAVVAEEMNKKGFTVNKLHVENKLKAMKGQYHMAELTLKQSGFSFNHITKCVDAEDDVWERWILHNKDAKPLRTKGLKYYKECELMFGKDYATGGANFVANDYDHRSQTGENDHETINLDESDCPTTDVLISPIPPESSKGEHKKTTPTTNKRRRSRVSNEDPGLPALEKMANVAASIAESLVRPSKKKLHEALKAIPNMEKKNILHAYNLIGKDDNLVENFFGLDEGDRREWVMDQLGLE